MTKTSICDDGKADGARFRAPHEEIYLHRVLAFTRKCTTLGNAPLGLGLFSLFPAICNTTIIKYDNK